MNFWTTWLDYKSTGKGRTVMACLTYAETEWEAIANFQEKFGEYFAMGCMSEAGLVRNKVVKLLFSKAALDAVEQAPAGKEDIMLYASLHLSEVAGMQGDLLI